MSRFIDGPAEGIDLQLRRAPLLLRAVKSPLGKWDALDQLDDVPRADERIYVYQADPETLVRWHQRCSGKNRAASGFYEACEYRFLHDQPADDVLRDPAKWAAWMTERGQQIQAAAAEKRNL